MTQNEEILKARLEIQNELQVLAKRVEEMREIMRNDYLELSSLQGDPTDDILVENRVINVANKTALKSIHHTLDSVYWMLQDISGYVESEKD